MSEPLPPTTGNSPTHGKVTLKASSIRATAEYIRLRHRQDMDGKFLRMTPQEFMQNFLPVEASTKKPSPRGAFNALNLSSENSLQQSFVSASHCPTSCSCFEDPRNSQIKRVNDKNRCPGFELVDTKDRPEAYDASKLRVDACLFKKGAVPVSGNNERISPNWDLQKLHIEFKVSTTRDAFEDRISENETRTLSESTTNDGIDTRGQIISYAALVFQYQPRCFFFSLLVIGKEARIIRWDRSGAVVTDRFNYQTSPDILCEFLDRFSRMESEGRDGIDPTVRPVSDDERNLMIHAASTDNKLPVRDYARVAFKRTLDRNRKWWKLSFLSDSLPGENAGDPDLSASATRKERHFLVGTPRFCEGGMVGRGTRGYVALDLENSDAGYRKFVWLKDAWRVDHEGIRKEGTTLHTLNTTHVSYVPTMLYHGDVGNQCTDTHTFWPGNPTANPFKRYAHYRMVVAEVGLSLQKFQTGEDLVKFVFHCLIGERRHHPPAVLKTCSDFQITAHMQAFRAGILHRDISTGNILIVERSDSPGSWMGVLTDWELSVPTDQDSPRQPHRTVSI